MKIHAFSTLALAAAAALVLPPEAHAREGGYVAAGLGAVPEYEGASSQQAVPFLAAPPNYCVNLTRTLFYFSGHSDLTEGVVYGNTGSPNGGPLRS